MARLSFQRPVSVMGTRCMETLPENVLLAVITLVSSCGMFLLGPNGEGSLCAYGSSIPEWPRCEIQRGPCTGKADDLEVTLDITPKPVRAMEELIFSVRIKGGGVHDKVVLDLSMPGMYMGRNRVVLNRADDGRYRGKGILPRCPSGGGLWSATVETPHKARIGFLFDVIP